MSFIGRPRSRAWLRSPSLYAHPLDPPGQHIAAGMFGKVVAMRLMEPADALPDLVAAAIEAGYRGDLIGLRCRLAWTMSAAVAAWEIMRDKAAFAIRQTVAPLFAEWAEPDAIRTAAHRENASWQDPLLTYEVMDLVRDEAERFMRTKGRRRHA